MGAQFAGAIVGTVSANVMFGLAAVEVSTTVRSSGPLWFAEVVATIGLLLVIQGCVRSAWAITLPFAVAAWIAGAYWFTSSTSFANPAVTVGRIFSDSFAGIAPTSAPAFVLMQFIGTGIAIGLIRILYPDTHPRPLDAQPIPEQR